MTTNDDQAIDKLREHRRRQASQSPVEMTTLPELMAGQTTKLPDFLEELMIREGLGERGLAIQLGRCWVRQWVNPDGQPEVVLWLSFLGMDDDNMGFALRFNRPKEITELIDQLTAFRDKVWEPT